MAKYALCLLSTLLALMFGASRALSAEDANLAPADLVRRAVHNEIASNQRTGSHFMFKDEKRTPQLSQTKLMVETQDATAGLLIMQNGHPLSAEERRNEDARLASYSGNTQELRKKKKQEKEDAEHTERILGALPDAFIYQRDGTQIGSEGLGAPGHQLVQLNFRPNPNYNPPSHVEQVLTGMSGHLLIDTTEERIAEIDGTLQKEVEFGWGILGHLDPGGRFLVQQADVGELQWEVTHMQLSFTGKMLLFHKFSIHTNETFSDFRPVPTLTFAQGVELLKKEAAENHSGAAPREANQEKTNVTAQEQHKNVGEREAKILCCDR